MNIGESFSALNLNDSALHYFKLSLVAGKQWDESYVLAKCYLGLAALDAKKNDYSGALEKAMESYQLADQSSLASLKAEISGMMASYFAKAGNYRQAYQFKTIESQVRDSLFNSEKYKALNEIEAIYQNQKKEDIIEALSSEKEIEVLKNRQSKYYILSLVTFLLIIISGGLMLLHYNRVNSMRKTIEIEQRLLRSQMNPHFIFNAISCIQEFIMDKNPLDANSYLSSFAKLMRSILNNSSREFISLAEEIETLEHYLKLQKLRFPEKLEYKIEIGNELEPEDVLLPPMLSQPFIENAVNHGIAKKKNGQGMVSIHYQIKNKGLFVCIKDNGIGINSQENQSKSVHKSMATKITRSRIANFAKAYRSKVNFELIDLFDADLKLSGTEVVFELPLKINKLV